MGRSLVLRRTRDGQLKLAGQEWPAEHVFPFSWLQREIGNGTVTVSITVDTVDGPVSYEFAGFDPHVDQYEQPVLDANGDPKPNYTAWRCRKATTGEEV